MNLLRTATLALALLGLAGCYEEPVAITTFPPGQQATPIPATTTATPTARPATLEPPPTSTPLPQTTPPPATPRPVAVVATPYPGCVAGWVEPVVGMTEYESGLTILEDYMGVTGGWTVTEMRYFTGPDAPGVIEPHFDTVERWYIKAALASNESFRGRWLIEKRTDLILGVSAVAPFDTAGYQSPDWTGFIGEGPPTTYIGLPGQWSGIPYDFVTGDGDGGQPGLPDEVTECLAGT